MKRFLLALVLAVIAAGVAYKILATAPTPAPSAEGSSVSVSTEISAPPSAPPVAQTSVPAPSTVTGAPVTGVTPEEFARKTESVFASLPKVANLRKLPAEQVHRTPPELVNAGAEIGDLADAIEKNPALTPQGLAFYGKCARAADISLSVRALCLGDLRSLSRHVGGTADESGVAPEVAKAADLLKP